MSFEWETSDWHQDIYQFLDWEKFALHKIRSELKVLGRKMQALAAEEQQPLWQRIDKLLWWERFVNKELREAGE